ncbi:Inner kinetochore subunit mis15 [Paramyrothecium foliicola]|nr:Inner kinetochore subunit mis15 [Paramyrothecium foliicola]
MPRISVPTAARLSSTLRVDASNQAVSKLLGRLSREALISLALDWLDDETVPNAIPYLDDGEDEAADDIYPPCSSTQELQQLYLDMQDQKGSKRDVVSRILEGDWRHGLTMYQLAMADLTYLDEHPSSQKWSAYQILPLQNPMKGPDEEQIIKVDKKSLEIPRFHPATFLQHLQDQVLPDIKAHYQFYRPKEFPVLILRIFVVESPYNSTMALKGPGVDDDSTNFDSSRTVYLAFPDGSPSLYVTKSQSTGATSAGESRSLHNLIVEGVPKALSRPRQRYTLKTTNITSRNLRALLATRGSGRGNAAGGGWSIYADDKLKASPLDTVLPTPPLSRGSSEPYSGRKRQLSLGVRSNASKRARMVAEARFGRSGIVTDGRGIEKVEVVLTDPFPVANGFVDHGSDEEQDTQAATGASKSRRSQLSSISEQASGDEHEEMDLGNQDKSSGWKPTVKINFQGQHVFAGIRQLVEAGIIDGERMPGWMTGEEGVTMGIVAQGRIQSRTGSGL